MPFPLIAWAALAVGGGALAWINRDKISKWFDSEEGKKFLEQTKNALESVTDDQNRFIDKLFDLDPDERYKRLIAARKVKDNYWYILLESACDRRIKKGDFKFAVLLAEIQEVKQKFRSSDGV